MTSHVVIKYHLKADPSEEKTISIYKVPNGHTLRITSVEIRFPSGTGGELLVALKYGNMKVYPDSGYASGDGGTIRDDVDITYQSGLDVLLYYKNENTTDVREAYINLEGELND